MYVFDGCSSLTSVTLPEGVTYIAQGVFARCSSLTSVTLPEGVTSIGSNAFQGCSSLTSVTIPEGVTYIREQAFAGCSSLTSVYYLADQLIEASSNVFSEETYQNATLYLSEEGVMLSSYKDPWKNFINILDYDLAGIEEVIADFDENAIYEIYNLNGVKIGDSLEGLTPGLYIVRQGNRVKKITVK